MIRAYLLFFISTIAISAVHAQERLKGIVLEYKGDEAMQQVLVKNLNTKDSAYTNKQGEFSIVAKTDDILSFSYPGYRTDSLVVIDFSIKRVYMSSIDDPRMLEEVNINELTNNRIAEEKKRLQKVGQYGATASSTDGRLGRSRMGGIALSPSRLFGSEAKNARRQYRALTEESNNRLIDARFTEGLVTGLTPLTGEDLTLFMVKYRPKVSFIKEANDETLKIYVLDSYNKFKTLSPAAKKKIKIDEVGKEEAKK